MNRHSKVALASAMFIALGRPAHAQNAPAAAPPETAPVAPAKPTLPNAGAPAVPPPAEAPPDAQAKASPGGGSDLARQVDMQRADLDEQDQRIAELEQQLKALKTGPTGKAAEKKTDDVTQKARAVAPATTDYPLKITGYAQAQYEFHQDSEDQLAQGGTVLNQNRFLLRRTRVKLVRDWQYGGLMIELDANTVRGPAFGVQHAEVSLAYRNKDLSPFAQLTLGLFDNPFGREVVESPRERPFVERSYASRAFFPAEPDLGLRISGQVAWFRYSAAVVNGQPLGDRTGYILQDPNSHKDVLGRVGVDLSLPHAVRFLGGVSVLNGKGFHAGSDATKNVLTWRDNVSENGAVEAGEIIGVPGVSAVRSLNFTRWLVGADLGAELVWKYGSTHLFGELSVGSNMDRNVFVADPTTNGFDEREFGYYLALYHEFQQGPIVGFRWDKYDPNSDFLDSSRRGQLIPVTETITTYSPLVGFQVRGKARLVAEWDIIDDALARNTLGVPVDRANNIVTLRLQGEM